MPHEGERIGGRGSKAREFEITEVYSPDDDYRTPTELQAAIATVLDDPDAGGFEIDDDGRVHPR